MTIQKQREEEVEEGKKGSNPVRGAEMHFDTSSCKEQVGNVTRGSGAELFEDKSEKSKEMGLLCISAPS